MVATNIRSSPSGQLYDVTGATGPFGGAVTLPYQFRSATSGDPSGGQLELDQAVQNTANLVYVSATDADGADVDSVLASMGTADNPTKGFIRLVSNADVTRWLIFAVTAVSANVLGVRTLSVSIVGQSTPSPLLDLATITLCFSQDGNIGATGPAGPLVDMVANSVLGNPTAGVATPIDIPMPVNSVLGRVAANIVAAALVTAQIGLNQITNPVLAQMAANTVKLNASAALADPQDFAIGTNTVLGRVAGNIVAAQVVTGQIGLNQVTNATLAQMAANTLKGNATAALADAQDIAVGTNSVVGRVAGNIVAAQIVTAQIGTNQVTNAVLAQMAALTVKGNATNALANADDIAAGSDDTVFRRTGSTLNFGQITAGMLPAGLIPLTSLATQAANTVVANATAGVASPTAVAVGTNSVLGRVAGNIVAAQIVTAQIALNQVTNAVLAQMSANTLKGNATAALADPQDITVGTNVVVGRVAGNIVAAQAVNAQIVGGALSTVKGVALGGVAGTLQDLTGTQIVEFLRWATIQNETLTGTTNDLALAAGTTVLRLISGTGPQTLTGITGGISGRLLIIEDVGTAGNEITLASNTGSVAANQFRAPGGVNYLLGFRGATFVVWDSGNGDWRILDRLLPAGGLAAIAANTILANATAASAQPTAFAIGTNTVLGRVAGNIVAAQLVTAQIAVNQVTNAVLAQMATNTLKGNATAALADAQDIAVGTNTVVGRVAGNIVAAQLVTTQIAVNQVTNAVLAQMAANTLKGNATAALADAQDIAVGTNTVVGRVGANIVASQIVTAQIAVNQVTNAVLAQMAALTVKANATNALANAADLAAGSDDTVLRRTGSTLNFGQLTAGMFPAAVIPLTSLATQAANTIVANATAGVASPTAVAVGTNVVVGRVAGNIVAAQLVTAQIAVNQVTNAVLAQMAANTLKGNATAALADAQDIAVGTNVVVGRVSGNIVAAQLVTAQIAVNQVTNAVLAQMAALTVKANATNALANAADLAAGSDDTVLRRTGSTLNFGQLTAGMFPAAVIPLTSLATQAANTIVANATAGVASPTAVAVGTNVVVGRVAGNIVAAQIVTAQIAVNQVTNAVLAQMAALTVKANATNALANAADLAAGSDDTVLRRTGSTLNFGQLTAGMFPAAIIPLTSLATQVANTVVANATAGAASPTAVAVGTNTVLGRVAGNIVAAQLVTAQITDANVTLAKLADLASGTSIGRRIDDATGVPVALTGIEQGENLQIETGIVDSVTTGTQIAYSVPAPNNLLTFQNVTVRLEGVVARAGTHLWIRHTGTGSTTLVDEASGALSANRLSIGGGGIVLTNDQQALFLYQNGSWRCYGTSPRNALTEQIVTGSGPHDVTLDDGAMRLTFSGTSITINSVTGGSETGRLLMVYLNGSGTHRVINQGLGPGNSANIFNPRDDTAYYLTRGSFLLQANGSAGWRAFYPSGQLVPVSSITALTTTTNSTALRTVATLTVPANFIVAGTSYRAYLAVVTSRGATATAVSVALAFTISDGVSPVDLGGLTAAINTTASSSGNGILECVVTFHSAPGPTAQYTVSATSSHTITSATIVHAQPNPNLGLTYPTDVQLTFTLTAIMTAAVSNVSMTPISAYIEPVIVN